MPNEDTVVRRLGVTPEQLIGYAYAGLLAAFFATICEPAWVTEIVKALGSLLSVTIVLALGVGIYVLYFKLLGEFLLFPFQHTVHLSVDRFQRRTGVQHTSMIGYLGALGVPVGQRRAAYEATKATFFRERERRRIQLAHGELHVLYLTAVESAAVGIYLHLDARPAHAWLAATALFYLAALVADLRQHSLECSMLKSHAESDIRKFIASSGFTDMRVHPPVIDLEPTVPSAQAKVPAIPAPEA